MKRLIGILDLVFILLGSISVTLVMLSPEYRALNVTLPRAKGGKDMSQKKLRILVNNHAISCRDQVFQSVEEFRGFVSHVSASGKSVVLGIDQNVAFGRVSEVLGILSESGIRGIAFEVKEVQ